MMREKGRMTAAQAIVKNIKRENINHVFCVPGESYLPVLDALHDEPSIKVISNRHEGGAAFMAEGYAKSTLKPGIVLATRGVGAGNLAIGVHTAYQDSTPMIVLLGQVHSKFRGREGFQEVDLEQFFGPIAKWAVEITDADRTPEIMEKAFRISQTGRPGPVVISLPENVLPIEAEMRFRNSVVKPRPIPSANELISIVKKLQQAKKPIVIAGGGIKSSSAEQLLIEFAERFHIPIFVSFRRHDAFPHQNNHFVGHLGLGNNDYINEAFKEADFILSIGTRLSEVTTKDYTLIHDEQTLIHIDIEPLVIGNVYSPDIGIVADASEAIKAMLSINIEKSWSEWTETLRSQYDRASKLTTNEDDEINKHIIKHMQETLPTNAVITNDAGNFASWLHQYYTFLEPHTYVGPTSGAMGYGLPAALGAKLAFPQKTVVALAGDGGFMMTVQELETAVRYNIHVICLVFNNKMYGTIRMHQEIHYPKKVIGTDLGDVSFSKLAQSVGAEGYTVKTMDQFTEKFQQALDNRKVTVIEIITDREQISVGKTIEELRK